MGAEALNARSSFHAGDGRMRWRIITSVVRDVSLRERADPARMEQAWESCGRALKLVAAVADASREFPSTMRIQFWLGVALTAAVVFGAGRSIARSDGVTPSVREEFFVLELEGDPVDASGPVRTAVGSAVLRVRSGDGGGGAEWDVRFDDDSTRVLHVEEWPALAAKLVWREWRPGSGRTVVVEGSADQSRLDVLEWGRSQRSRAIVATQGRLHLPLQLLEAARSGELRSGPTARFDPLSSTAEVVHVAIEFAAGGVDGLLERRWTLLADDGVSVGTMVFRGDQLTELRWQGGGLVARRVEDEEYRARLQGASAVVSDAR